MKTLVACEESQVVTKEFRSKGHEAFKCENCMYYTAAENMEVMPGPFTGFCICPKKGKNAVDFAYRKANCYYFRERGK